MSHVRTLFNSQSPLAAPTPGAAPSGTSRHRQELATWPPTAGDEPEDYRRAEKPSYPTPHSDKSLPSKHRAMVTQDCLLISMAPPCHRRRFRCRESAAHDLPQLRYASCAPFIVVCRCYLVEWTLRTRTAESYANAGSAPLT